MDSARSLRILFTNNTLAYRAGSELFVLELAVALRARGHRPIAFSTVLGEIADRLRAAAIPVIDDLGALAVAPDIIHGQHHLELATTQLRFPETRAIHVCHGWLPWEEEPLRFPTIQRYVAVSNLTRERLLTSGIAPDLIQIVPNFVDTERFRPRGPLAGPPATAAVFSNYISSEHPHYQAIVAACAQLGCEKVDLIGASAGTATDRPEEVLPRYDLVFAAGRCALEALASGCAVIVADHHGLAGLVTLASLDELRSGNFGIATTYGKPATRAKVAAEIARIAPSEVEAVSEAVRARASLSSAVTIWERLYLDALAAHWPSDASVRLTSAASDYLRKLNPVIKSRHAAWQALLARSDAGVQKMSAIEVELAAAQRTAAALATERDERSASLSQARTTIAALEAAVAAAEEHANDLGWRLAASTAQLSRHAQAMTDAVRQVEARAEQRIAALEAEAAKARQKIAALEARVKHADRRVVEIGATLDRTAAELTVARERSAALEDTARQVEQRLSEVGAALDEATAELTGARDRGAVLERALAVREHELAVTNQRIVRIKGSLSWRLTAPFRELYRPVRLLHASHFGKKLSAALRHPFSSRKRKAYRASEWPFAPSTSEVRRGAPLGVRLRVFIRHPFSSTQRKQYRASNQSWRKSTPELGPRTQVDKSPAAREAPRPRIESPAAERDAGGFRGRILEALKPFYETGANWQFQPPVVHKLSHDALLAQLRHLPDAIAVISFSQDNYREAVGGIQLCLHIEEAAYKRRGAAYIHLSPYQPLPGLAPNGLSLDYKFALTLNGSFLGHIVAGDLCEVLAAQNARGVTHELVVHSLLGHSPEVVAELAQAAGISQGIYWVHDYFSLCPSYTLMRNSVSHCNAPPPSSPGCQICYVGSHRPGHLRRMRDLFSQIEFTLVAPSAAALAVWQASTDFPVQAAIVHEHCRVTKERVLVPEPTARAAAASAPLRVAFLGFPAVHKGWPVFCDVVQLTTGDKSYDFYHLGRVRSDPSPGQIRFVRADATTKDWQAVSKAVSQNRIDVAFLCSLWPETYNFTTLEALAGGALIITLEGSGNIAALVRKHDCGLVFPSEAALKEAFATGTLLTEIRNMQRRGASRYTYAFSDMTAGIRLGQGGNQ